LSRVSLELGTLRSLAKHLLKVALPFTHWLPEAIKPSNIRADLVAGVTTGLVVVPQSMQLAGLPPHVGLYASFLPAIVAALFGSSRQLSTGPVAVVSLLTAAALEPMVRMNPDSYVAYAVVLAIVVGVFQLLLGVLRLGVIVNFLSHPVVIGFTNAGAIIIAASQLPKLLGITLPASEHLYEQLWLLAKAIPAQTHLPSLAIGILAGAIILGVKRFAPRIPGILLAVVLTTVLSWQLNLEGLGVRVIGVVPSGLPKFELPALMWAEWLKLIPVAVAISIIGFMESISIAKSMAGQTRQRLDPNQELIGQGLANIASGFNQGCPVSGSFARSAVNFGAGAKTGVSSIVTGLTVAITLLALTRLLHHLPLPVLAAIVITAVVNLVNVRAVVAAWKVHRDDGVVALITFVAIVIMAPHLETGLLIGVILSLALYLARTMRPTVTELSRHADGTLRPVELFDLPQCPSIAMMRFDGSLYFANAPAFENLILDKVATHPEVEFVVLDAQSINEIDDTGIHVLTTLEERLRASGIELLFARAKRQITRPLARVGFLDKERDAKMFGIRNQAIMYAWSKIDHCPKEGCTQSCPLRRHTDDTSASMPEPPGSE